MAILYIVGGISLIVISALRSTTTADRYNFALIIAGLSHNPILSKKFCAHINLKICASIQSIKYTHKYIYKGTDRILLKITHYAPEGAVQAHEQLPIAINEVEIYLQSRHIGPTEACWRICYE